MSLVACHKCHATTVLGEPHECEPPACSYPLAVTVREIAEKILARLVIHGRCGSCRKIVDGESESLHPWAQARDCCDPKAEPDQIVYECEACSGIPPARVEHWAEVIDADFMITEFDEAAGRG